MTDERWWWWAGNFEDVDAEGVYSHGEYGTRDEVIAAILPDLCERETFVVIEAQFGDHGGDDGNDEFIPFKSVRNKEFLMKQGDEAVPAPATDDPLVYSGVSHGTCRVCKAAKLVNDDGRCLECYMTKPRPERELVER